MRTRPKRRQVATAGLVLRFRDGTCTRSCRRCGQWEAFTRWRTALSSARAHAGEHHAAQTRYNLGANGVNALQRPRTTPRRRLRRHLAVVLAVLAVLAFTITTVTVAAVTSRAAPQPAPAIGIVATTTTTAAGPGPGREAGYVLTPAGPPATDHQGQWIPEPASSTSTSSSAGGGR